MLRTYRGPGANAFTAYALTCSWEPEARLRSRPQGPEPYPLKESRRCTCDLLSLGMLVIAQEPVLVRVHGDKVLFQGIWDHNACMQRPVFKACTRDLSIAGS